VLLIDLVTLAMNLLLLITLHLSKGDLSKNLWFLLMKIIHDAVQIKEFGFILNYIIMIGLTETL
jgi:hypothetical protein